MQTKLTIMQRKTIFTILLTLAIGFVFINVTSIKTKPSTPLFSATKNIITDTIHVDGNCNMCKNRIEDAALIKGVKKAVWDKQTDKLVVVYDADKTSLMKIEKSVAAVGHDTPNFKADDKVYNKLPKCCLYRDPNAKTH